jgi:hypothetical protein
MKSKNTISELRSEKAGESRKKAETQEACEVGNRTRTASGFLWNRTGKFPSPWR